ncbi:hypothetical protein GCM10009122_42290 [Fulvivirga kasyanovii]|uniref:Uncharacterized protein n=1 Tax=Fulvivirga kasyanovii TaxID=396812 RepID=A0ABW9RHS2_9BACT|nr:hypothetical protein [Fulvivirga kasyanovii]MTI23442.1 hypothetical protein [Fulvivirga kasyanovii]
MVEHSDPTTFTATFESENAAEEEELYANIQDTRVTFNNADANADGGDKVVRLNGTQPAAQA